MVARHCKLSILLLNYEIGKLFRLLMRELIAEAQTIVIETETDIYKESTLITTQLNEQLVVVVANFVALAPYRLPGLVKGCSFATEHREAFTHRVDWSLWLTIVETIGFICVIHKFKTESTRLYDLLAVVGESIGWYTTLLQREGHLHLAIRRG